MSAHGRIGEHGDVGEASRFASSDLPPFSKRIEDGVFIEI
jgi:hypothetical protein